MKWTNFYTDHYKKVVEAKKGQKYNTPFLLKKYFEINEHLTLDEACDKFQIKFKPILK